jgi:SAM-dependent methyltransferase
MTADHIADALLAVAAGDQDRAMASARAATLDGPAGTPSRRLADALLRHLDRGEGDVYGSPAAFERFIDGGGNVALYERAHAALAERHARHGPATVLDLGCGDGRLSLAALQPGLTRLDLVEPSAELLATAQARLAGHPVVAHQRTAQELVDTLADEVGWDIAQSTFALHAVPPADRARVLAALARHVRRLLVVEFDVPLFADRSADHARYAAERYAAGIAEYEDDDLVVDGFLVPVLVGQFDPSRPRHTWEQPIDAWVADLTSAGFTTVRHDLVHPYWWAPAHLLDATPP